MSRAVAVGEAVELTTPLAPSPGERRRRFMYVVWTAASATFRRRYAGTFLGYAWMVLQPLLLFAVLYAVFTQVIRFGGAVPHYASMLLINIVFFYFFREAGATSMRSFVARKGIINSVRIPPLAMPFASVLAAGFVFGANLVVALVWALASDVPLQLGWLALPILVGYMVVVTTAIGVLLACTYVRVRDVAQVWRPMVRLLFYVSGTIFPFSMIPSELFRTLAAVNPLSPLFVQIRVWIIDSSAPQWPESAGSTLATILPFLSLVLICAAAAIAYRVTRKAIAESL